MDNHIQNLKKVCRFCGQKKDRLKPLTSYVRGLVKIAHVPLFSDWNRRGQDSLHDHFESLGHLMA